jgi:hypothetical protein
MKQRTYTQRRHRTQRTQRARHTRHLRQRGGEKQKIIVLSNSNIKKDAMRDIFKPDRYELIPIEIKDNPARAPQPLFIDGTKQACAHRIKDYYTGINEETKVPHFRSDLPPDTPVVSIENGILSIDGEKLSSGALASSAVSDRGLTADDYAELHWADFCVIGLARGPSEPPTFVISPEIIGIDKEDSEPYFREHYNKTEEMDTLGKYIVYRRPEQTIAHNNWMLKVAGIDRRDQIKKGLVRIAEIIEK